MCAAVLPSLWHSHPPCTFQVLADEKSISSKYEEERDYAEAEARNKESKVLSLTQALEESRDTQEELERTNKSLRSELEALISSKHDVGKNVSHASTAEKAIWNSMHIIKSIC